MGDNKKYAVCNKMTPFNNDINNRAIVEDFLDSNISKFSILFDDYIKNPIVLFHCPVDISKYPMMEGMIHNRNCYKHIVVCMKTRYLKIFDVHKNNIKTHSLISKYGFSEENVRSMLMPINIRIRLMIYAYPLMVVHFSNDYIYRMVDAFRKTLFEHYKALTDYVFRGIKNKTVTMRYTPEDIWPSLHTDIILYYYETTINNLCKINNEPQIEYWIIDNLISIIRLKDDTIRISIRFL